MQNKNRKDNHTGKYKYLRGSAIGLHPQAVLRTKFHYEKRTDYKDSIKLLSQNQNTNTPNEHTHQKHVT